jgi:hypothetical protein
VRHSALCYQHKLIPTGALAILIALGVVLIMRSRRKKNPKLTRNELSNIAAVENAIGPFYSPPSPSVYSVKTRKADEKPVGDNPFLTESEKAIVMRAASRDGALAVSTTCLIAKPLQRHVLTPFHRQTIRSPKQASKMQLRLSLPNHDA